MQSRASGSWTANADDSVGLYLREISATPLLTAAEELVLAERLARGRVAARRLQSETLTADERRRLLAQQSDGIAARRRLIEANLRLVVSVAKRYRSTTMSLLDLIQEGNVGLMHAIDKFDPSKGFRLSTYSIWWIRQAISRGVIEKEGMVRVPVNRTEVIRKVARLAERLQQEHGRVATARELGQELGLSLDQVLDHLGGTGQPMSLDAPVDREGETALAELVPDNATPEPLDQAIHAMLREHLARAMGVLSQRERTVLMLRFGLWADDDHTLQECGRAMNISAERVRQIEHRALKKLRNPAVNWQLRGFAE
jgi:RNA polymerase primary sigma factor